MSLYSANERVCEGRLGSSVEVIVARAHSAACVMTDNQCCKQDSEVEYWHTSWSDMRAVYGGTQRDHVFVHVAFKES